MTTSERFERDVPGLLEELYLGPTPPYRDDILRRTAATRQRPGWTFIERWIPVSAITGRLTAAPRVQWRAVALATLLLIAIAAAAIFVGSRQSRVPPPFGPASNGQIPYISEGNIYLGDPVTGETKLIVGDAGDDALPQFSPDGRGSPSSATFRSMAPGRSRSTSTSPTPMAPPAGRSTPSGSGTGSGSAGLRTVRIWPSSTASTWSTCSTPSATAPPKRITAAAGTDFIQFRPPDGREILYRGRVEGEAWGLFAMDADWTDPRLLVKSLDSGFNPLDLGSAVYSADGSQIFYQRADPAMAHGPVLSAVGHERRRRQRRPRVRSSRWPGMGRPGGRVSRRSLGRLLASTQRRDAPWHLRGQLGRHWPGDRNRPEADRDPSSSCGRPTPRRS